MLLAPLNFIRLSSYILGEHYSSDLGQEPELDALYSQCPKSYSKCHSAVNVQLIAQVSINGPAAEFHRIRFDDARIVASIHQAVTLVVNNSVLQLNRAARIAMLPLV